MYIKVRSRKEKIAGIKLKIEEKINAELAARSIIIKTTNKDFTIDM